MSSRKPEVPARFMPVLALMNRGLSNREIAKRLKLSPTSVATYQTQLIKLFDTTLKYDMVMAARKAGIIPTIKNGISRAVLTKRQKDVLQLARRGLMPKEIADRLGIMPDGAASAIELVQRKTGTTTVLETVDAAVRMGLLPGEPVVEVRNPFTPREVELLVREARGMTRQEIADDLGVSRPYVNNQMQIMRAKARAETVDEMMDVAERLGLVQGRKRPSYVSRGRLEKLKAERKKPILTPRMLDILGEFRRHPGMTNARIAERLGVCKGLVDQYSFRLRMHFGVKTRAELLERAKTDGYEMLGTRSGQRKR